MEQTIQLIIGLGNPGIRYENTRHNIGAMFVQYLANKNNSELKKETKFKGYIDQLTLPTNESYKVFIPDEFMNLSGLPIQLITNYYKIKPQQLLIVHDDLDLSLGQIKCKFAGGHGGHNGLRDIDSHLNSNQYHRLRIGIGHPGSKHDVSNYVLSKVTKDENSIFTHSFEKIITVLQDIIQGHWNQVKNKLHTINN